MYLKSCCALFLLALVACQAAPSPKMIEKKSISEAETTFAKNDIKLEDSGAEKDRAKKSATTFCLEVRSGKQEQVPCRQEVKPQEVVHRQDKPVVVLQPISVSAPAPVIDYARQPIVIQQQLPQPQQQLPQPQQQLPQPQPQLQPQPQPQPQPQSFHVIQQQSSLANFNYPQPQVVPTYEPAPQQTQRIEPPAPAPAPVQTHTPIINIVPAAAPASCDKTTILQPPQPQQIHTVHVIHQQPQPQPTQRPSVTFIQEVKPNKEEKPIHKSPKPSLRPKTLPIPHQEISIVPIAPSYKTEVVAPARPLEFLVPRPYIEYVQSVKPQEEGYECSCRPENRIPTLTPYVTSRFPKVPESRVEYSSGAFESLPYYRSSMMSEDNPIIMPEQSMFYASEGAREAEGRHHKKKYGNYPPLQLSVQFPIQAPANFPNYQPYQPSYINPQTYSSSYATYPNSCGTSYPVSYDSQASADTVPSITVNAGGPFYRESQHIDTSPQLNDGALSTTTEIIDGTNNQKREADLIQLKNEQKETEREEHQDNFVNQHS